MGCRVDPHTHGFVGIRLMLVAVVGLVGPLITACGETGGARAHIDLPETSAACVENADPDGCLRFLQRAVPVRSIRLTARVPAQVEATCRAAARLTHLEVLCPPLVPIGGVVHDHELYGPQIVDRRSYSASINNGQNPGHIHWEFGAIRGPATRLWVFDRRDWDAPPNTPPARRIVRRRYLGHLITIYRFPENGGQLAGHDAAFASEGGISYFASLHGHRHDDADIAMLLAVLLSRAS